MRFFAAVVVASFLSSVSPLAADIQIAKTTIAAIHNGEVSSGRWIVDGYLVNLMPCAPCPPRAVCEGCIGEYVMVSDLKPRAGAKMLSMPVFVKSLRDLETGRRYRLSIDIPSGFRPEKPYDIPRLRLDRADPRSN